MANYDDDGKDGEDETTSDIKIPPTTTTGHFCVDIQQEGEGSRAGQGMKEMYKMKLQHAQATEILNLLCPNILMLLNVEKRNMIRIALNCAAQQDNAEFVLRVTKANPELIALVTSVCLNYPVFVITAVEYRKAAVFSLFLCRHFEIMAAATPAKMRAARETGNNLLHLAASLAPDSYLNSISGAALQMQRELQWFKAVESVVDAGYRLHQNKEGLIPIEYFKKNHKGLRAEGEKWMKDTASSCSVVGTLIVTIMFTAALTVPGGNNQDSGYPMFIKEKLFKVFLISDALSLFSSTTSVLVFLGILTSRYAEEDFLCSLPTKLIIGLSTLFLSIATMMISFSATIMIMLQYNSLRLWVTLPITMLAGVPVTLFVLLQFPLLVKVFSSTYGPSIFKKKVEEWS
ncbi:ankyrin repeat-containing protein ITN1-like [Neltuma alba]|uniref:ankyrin repeat-containing protein ITN1-like n=1 Tax=Neltuma alba TaxID=207710 RepID=UPI0010A45BA3|nr:ankyrin repeat-containing protein ITN1-like [Prosopis alba]